MRPRLLMLGWALCAAMLPSMAPAAPAAPASPLLGTWTLDLNTMPVPPEFRPASVTMTVADAGQGEWRVSYAIIAKDGTARRMRSSEKLDGTAGPIEGDQIEADSVALSRPAPNILVMGLSKGGRPGSVRVYTVASDARTMTESAANVGDDGKPFIRSFRWKRAVSGR
jgi:hypothetical protein